MSPQLNHPPRNKTAARGRVVRLLGVLWILGTSMLAGALPGPAVAQPVRFGASDDPAERIQEVWWRRESTLHVRGGLSLIAAQWRGTGSLTLNLVTRSLQARLDGTIRAGLLGEYAPDFDETYDLLRLLAFARYEGPVNSRFHLRAGLIDRMRLGTGHVVNFFTSAVAWDERTVGLESTWQGRVLELAGFTDNLLFDGVTGGRAALRPLAWTHPLATRTLQLGVNYVVDLAPVPDDAEQLRAYNMDARFDLFESGGIVFSPYFSYARYTNFGDGIGFGADFWSDAFLDLLSFRFRLGLFYNDERFIPGYVGAFYTVSNPQARIFDSSTDREEGRFAGTLLKDSNGANDLVTELHLQVGPRFEWWYYFRRHHGAQRLGEMHLRFYLRTTNRLHFEVGIDRERLGGFFTLFNDMDDLSHLVFGFDYRLAGPFWLYLRTRYSYERVDGGDDHAQRYLVQRRFEPMTGFRLRW